VLAGEFQNEMRRQGIEFIFTCTFRPQPEQDELYAQGRTKPGRIVTWTRNSKHTKREAFDIAVIKNGKITWYADDYKKPGEIGMNLGLNWGGNFKAKDMPHFELKRGI
jgi:peptidoglycan LD-endopeptidase CwlK